MWVNFFLFQLNCNNTIPFQNTVLWHVFNKIWTILSLMMRREDVRGSAGGACVYTWKFWSLRALELESWSFRALELWNLRAWELNSLISWEPLCLRALEFEGFGAWGLWNIRSLELESLRAWEVESFRAWKI